MSQARTKIINQLANDAGQSLREFLNARVKNAQEAEDIAQEAFLRIWRSDNPAILQEPRAFLFSIAKNLVIDRSRRRRRSERALALLPAELTVQDDSARPSSEQQASDEQELGLITEAIDKLPANTRRAFELHRFAGLTYGAIAEDMGISKSMVEKHIAQALLLLKKSLPEAD